MGGRALVFPCVQTIQRLPLNTMTLEVKTTKVYTAQVDIIYNISTESRTYLLPQGVPLTVVGVAQVKINGADEDMLSYAAEQFGGGMNFLHC